VACISRCLTSSPKDVFKPKLFPLTNLRWPKISETIRLTNLIEWYLQQLRVLSPLLQWFSAGWQDCNYLIFSEREMIVNWCCSLPNNKLNTFLKISQGRLPGPGGWHGLNILVQITILKTRTLDWVCFLKRGRMVRKK